MAIASISLLTFRDGASPAERAALLDQLHRVNSMASDVADTLVAHDLPPNRNGGDVIWRMEFGNDADFAALNASPAWQAGLAAVEAGFGHVERFSFEPIAVGERGEQRRGGLYRLLVLALEDDTPDDVRRQFEADMEAMPRYVGTILRWTFGRVVRSAGAHRWSYLWEQEFSDLAGFRGEYMAHPYHWGLVDRWFDRENPARIVRPYLCNSFCPIDAPVMFTRWPRPEITPFKG